VIVGIVPAVAVNFAVNRSAPYAEAWNEPWPNEPELIQFLSGNIGRTIGRPFRGSVHFPGYDEHAGLTIISLWATGVSTVHEYGQVVTPQAFYFLHGIFQNSVT